MWGCVCLGEGYLYSPTIGAFCTDMGVDSHGGRCFHLSSLRVTGTCQTPMAFQCVAATIPDSCEFCAYNHLGMSDARRNLVNCIFVHVFHNNGHTIRSTCSSILSTGMAVYKC